MRLGIVGLGRVYERVYRPALKALGGRAVIAAVAEPDPLRRAEMTPKDAVEYAHMVDMIDREQLDGVLILSPVPVHVEQIRIAAQAGVDAVVESPICVGSDDLRHIGGDRARRKVVPAFSRRFWDDYRILRADRPATGRVNVTRVIDWDSWQAISPVQLRAEHDVLPELVDLLVWMFGSRPARVEGRQLRNSAEAILGFNGSAQAVSATAIHGTVDEETITLGNDQPIEVCRATGGSLLGRFRSKQSKPVVGMAHFLQAWMRYVQEEEREPELPTFDDAYMAAMVVDAWHESLRQGGRPADVGSDSQAAA